MHCTASNCALGLLVLKKNFKTSSSHCKLKYPCLFVCLSICTYTDQLWSLSKSFYFHPSSLIKPPKNTYGSWLYSFDILVMWLIYHIVKLSIHGCLSICT